MTVLPKPPAEVPRDASLDALAPKFRAAVEHIIADMTAAGWPAFVFEGLRTDDRQRFLYGFGREYDDGRGPVTKARDTSRSWHGYGLAVDIVQADATPWTAPQAFWQTLGAAAERHGCTWGGRWKMVDLPHVQWGLCKVSPSLLAVQLKQDGGLPAVWEAVRAD